MLKIIRIRTYPIETTTKYGIDFIATKTKSKNKLTHYRTIKRTKKEIEKLEKLIKNNG